MDDEEVLQARRILLLEEIERQKLVAHSRTARHPEMIMAYEVRLLACPRVCRRYTDWIT